MFLGFFRLQGEYNIIIWSDFNVKVCKELFSCALTVTSLEGLQWAGARTPGGKSSLNYK